MDMKNRLKGILPNLSNYLSLVCSKKKNKEKIEKYQNVDENEYPMILYEAYKKKTGHELHLENPRRFTEKIQWRKLYDHNPIYSTLSDKYAVREWVEKKIGKGYLIPLIGAWEHFNEIDFSLLPEQFVLKTNNASHTNLIVLDKKSFMRQKWSAGRLFEYWLKTPFAYLEGLEMHYSAIKPMIIAEEYLRPDEGKKDLVDYKFHCFNGVPVLCQVIGDRSEGETIDFYDTNWQHVSLTRPPYPNAQRSREKPKSYDLMIKLVSTLSNGFSYVRVDMYEHKANVFFGEMTFTPASGMMKFDPDDWDYRLGDLWNTNGEQVNQSVIGL